MKRIAIDVADIVLLGHDSKAIPYLLGLAATGFLTPVLGALVHNAGSVAVILHASLLLRARAVDPAAVLFVVRTGIGDTIMERGQGVGRNSSHGCGGWADLQKGTANPIDRRGRLQFPPETREEAVAR